MDNEEDKYRTLLNYMIQFYVAVSPGAKIHVEKIPAAAMFGDEKIPSYYYLELRCHYIETQIDGSLAPRYGLYHTAMGYTFKELYQKFALFKSDTHFFRKDSSLEEIKLKLAIRGIDDNRRKIQETV